MLVRVSCDAYYEADAAAYAVNPHCGSTTSLGGSMRGLEGKIGIVTGGGSGLGEAIAKSLAASGVKVVVSDINLKGAERVVQEIVVGGGTATAVQHDTASPEDNQR